MGVVKVARTGAPSSVSGEDEGYVEADDDETGDPGEDVEPPRIDMLAH